MRIALIGFGNIARKHVEVFKALGCDIVAACNRSAAARELAHTEGGIPQTYADYHIMIAACRPDAIIVCVPFDQIFHVTVDLIPYQIPLLIEKPAGISVAELQQLINLQQQFGTRVQVALNRRHYSVLQQALQQIGDPSIISFVHLEWSEAPQRVQQQRGYTDAQISQLIYGNSIHGLDTLLYITGPLSEQHITVTKKSAKFAWNITLSGRTATGTAVSYLNSWDTPIGWRIMIGAAGQRYTFAPLEKCIVTTSGSNEIVELLPDIGDQQFKAGFYEQTVYFLDWLQGRNDGSAHDLISALAGMKLAEEIYLNMQASQEKGQELSSNTTNA